MKNQAMLQRISRSSPAAEMEATGFTAFFAMIRETTLNGYFLFQIL